MFNRSRRHGPPGGENMMFRSDISVRDADQIEVVYGPGSTLYGQDAISAVINLITRQASWEMNAHILYSPIPSLDLYADFRNLTDHKYYLVASNTNSPTNSTNNGPYPIQAFQGTGGLRVVF